MIKKEYLKGERRFEQHLDQRYVQDFLKRFQIQEEDLTARMELPAAKAKPKPKISRNNIEVKDGSGE